MRINYYLELDIEDEQTINNLKTISDAERTTLDEALRNVLQNFFEKGGVTPFSGLPETARPSRTPTEQFNEETPRHTQRGHQ